MIKGRNGEGGSTEVGPERCDQCTAFFLSLFYSFYLYRGRAGPSVWGFEMIKAPCDCGVLTCTCMSAFTATPVTNWSNINSITESSLTLSHSLSLSIYIIWFQPPPK